jgi:hypothetical protein
MDKEEKEIQEEHNIKNQIALITLWVWTENLQYYNKSFNTSNENS